MRSLSHLLKRDEIMWTLSEFYKSKEWQMLLKQIRLTRIDSNGQTICEHCHKPIIRKYDCIGHHTEPLTEDNVNIPEISLNPDNIMLVHHKCHNKIHERFGTRPTRHVYIVYGSPCSGKSSYVSEVARRNDIIVDMDRLYQAISINDQYVKPRALTSNVFAMRDALIDSIRMRRGYWVNAYIIGGYPFESERTRLSATLGAELIYIDTDRETCLIRASERPDGWTDYVERWFEDHSPPPPEISGAG